MENFTFSEMSKIFKRLIGLKCSIYLTILELVKNKVIFVVIFSTEWSSQYWKKYYINYIIKRFLIERMVMEVAAFFILPIED